MRACQFHNIDLSASLAGSVKWHAVRDGGCDGLVDLPGEIQAHLPRVSNDRYPCRRTYGSVAAHKDGDGSAPLSSWMCVLYLNGSGTFTYIPDDPTLPTVSAPIQPGLLIKFDNKVGKHAVVGAEVPGAIATRVFVGPLTVAGALGRGGYECLDCGGDFHCGGCACCDCCGGFRGLRDRGYCKGKSKGKGRRKFSWLHCQHSERDGKGKGNSYQKHRCKGNGNGKGNDVDACEYCGGDLSVCIHAGTVPVTVNITHARIELSKINGDVLADFDLAARGDLNPPWSDWKVRHLLQFLMEETQAQFGQEAARNIYVTPNGLCLSKVTEDLASSTLHHFMALSRGQCCNPGWHGWYCHVCGTQCTSKTNTDYDRHQEQTMRTTPAPPGNQVERSTKSNLNQAEQQPKESEAMPKIPPLDALCDARRLRNRLRNLQATPIEAAKETTQTTLSTVSQSQPTPQETVIDQPSQHDMAKDLPVTKAPRYKDPPLGTVYKGY